MGESSTPNRWLIALAGTALQLCLGTVYAWSYFQEPLVRTYGWSNTQVTWAFSLTICCLGLAAAWGGIQLPRFGPRRLAVAGGILFGSGYLLAALALSWRSLPLLYLGYGVVGGCGLGLGYVTPVATVAKWFPDKKGLVTGMVIMGFGFGALLMSKLFAPFLYERTGGNLVMVFAFLGVGFMVATVAVASVLRNPPPGFAVGPAGRLPPSAAGTADAESPSRNGHARADVGSLRFGLLWAVFFCNILAGISIISFQSPLLQGLCRGIDPDLSLESLRDYGATLIAASSLFNGAGRMFWGGLSDYVGRARTIPFHAGQPGGRLPRVALGRQPLAFQWADLLRAVLLRRRIRHDVRFRARPVRRRPHGRALWIHSHSLVGGWHRRAAGGRLFEGPLRRTAFYLCVFGQRRRALGWPGAGTFAPGPRVGTDVVQVECGPLASRPACGKLKNFGGVAQLVRAAES